MTEGDNNYNISPEELSQKVARKTAELLLYEASQIRNIEVGLSAEEAIKRGFGFLMRDVEVGMLEIKDLSLQDPNSKEVLELLSINDGKMRVIKSAKEGSYTTAKIEFYHLACQRELEAADFRYKGNEVEALGSEKSANGFKIISQAIPERWRKFDENTVLDDMR